MSEENNIMPFDFPSSATSCIIKVIGVGGGGGNAVNHMYKEGIHDVAFVVCNTDCKALEESPVPVKVQLGHEGLGAGNRPQKAREATEESLAEIQNMLNDGTKMVFITAGMGGGTGTGAAPLIAKVAKDMDILTVGIVTIPFRWEGHKKIDQALDGVEEISKNVDALLVINNEKLGEIYPDLSVISAFAKANDTLLVAAKSIAEIITMRGIINLDFNDVKTVLKDGGVAIMSTGFGEGENRVTTAINEAQHSPLLNNNDIFRSQKVLLNITYSSKHELMMNEMEEVREFMNKFNSDFETKFGMAIDDSLGERVKITLLATGFGVQDIHMKEMDDRMKKRTIEEEQRLAELEEKEEEKRIRREKFYEKDSKSKIRRKPRRNIYLFNPEDLDNDNIISMVETIPTYQRSKDMLDSLQTRMSNDNGFDQPDHANNEEDNVIHF
ncbi:MAG: cell division protein FtsZ [Bacteroidaceae bacterium]|nr:cell division protein FtsZ [Bacteroidaceae bacterium]